MAAVAAAAAVLPNAAWAQTTAQRDGRSGFHDFAPRRDGTNVTHLPVGAYEITVHDQGIEHNFHLHRPGRRPAHRGREVGQVTWLVNLVDGVYTFQCDPHANTMNGRFSVGTAHAPTAASAPPPPPNRASRR